MHLSNITIKALANAARMVLLTPLSLGFRLTKNELWIISERPDQARDNGYVFFRYLRENHPDQKVYYVIDKKAADYKKIMHYRNVIQFNSWQHFLYFCCSKIHISAHVGGCNPNNNPMARRMKKILGYKDVFLPHGVSYGIAEFCLAKYSGIDLFICSGKPEYDNVLKNYGYTKEQVAYTGFPRLDGWFDCKVNKKQILLMPTWRLYLAQNADTVFEQTRYYIAYQELINSSSLQQFLVDNNLMLIFYLHHNMRKYVEYFRTNCPNIEIVAQDDTYDIQELLKSSALLITDYSSVHFDFAYMGKPVLYYQFDREEFWEKQYSQSDFDAAKDGFGPVAYEKEELLNNLKNSYIREFSVQEIYKKNMNKFYLIRDQHNCDRVFEEIHNRFHK